MSREEKGGAREMVVERDRGGGETTKENGCDGL